jgi:hypothetical protein
VVDRYLGGLADSFLTMVRITSSERRKPTTYGILQIRSLRGISVTRRVAVILRRAVHLETRLAA